MMISQTKKITGSSEMAASIREFSWQETVLGSIENWDSNLVVHTNMMLSCPFPMMIWWGNEKIQLYNDACKKLSGIRKHQKSIDSLGMRAEECWSEAWDTIKRKLEILKNDPFGVFEEDQNIPIYCGGELAPMYWTFSYSNLQDSNGANAGLLIIFKETTHANIELRKKREKEMFLLGLSDRLRGIKEKETIETEAALQILNYFDLDEIGFAALSNDGDVSTIRNRVSRKRAKNTLENDEFTDTFESLISDAALKNLSTDIDNLYNVGNHTVLVTELNGNHKWREVMYLIAKYDYQWNNYIKSTIADASKRIGEFLTFAEGQEKLLISEARYRSLFDNILDAFMVIDFSFDSEGRPVNYTFVSTNPAFEVQTGLENVVGKTILEIMPDVEREWMDAYGSVAVTGKSAQFEQYNEATKRHYEVFASSVKDYPSQVVVVFRDITEIKLDMEGKKKFLNVASHELKTPLTSIYASIQFAQKMISDQKIERAASVLEKAVTSLNQMTKIINGFLHLSNLEEQHIELQKSVFNISGLLSNCCQEAKLQYSTHQFILESENCINVLADEEKIRLVIQNLLTNAVQYSPQKTVITISCRILDDKINISVQDKGIGIDDRSIKNIFKKFFRVKDNPVTGVSGLGLGLYVSCKIIKLHGFDLHVESSPGIGSTFSFTLNRN